MKPLASSFQKDPANTSCRLHGGKWNTEHFPCSPTRYYKDTIHQVESSASLQMEKPTPLPLVAWVILAAIDESPYSPTCKAVVCPVPLLGVFASVYFIPSVIGLILIPIETHTESSIQNASVNEERILAQRLIAWELASVVGTWDRPHLVPPGSSSSATRV